MGGLGAMIMTIVLTCLLGMKKMQKYKIDPAKTSYYFCTCTVVEWLCIFLFGKDMF